MSEFVRLLIGASEKAANIARIIRSEKELFQLLVEEKCDDKKNDRFIHDFKTLSDVLIQECLRHDISAVFPAMANSIFGEESNTFTNVLGESITVVVKDSEGETAELLTKVLNDNVSAAHILAKEVHREISTEGSATSFLSNDLVETYDDVGVWIDPIDGTNEYINGSIDDSDNANGRNNVDEEIIFQSGLHCVTVLIGAFNLKTGQPIVGVINQPFWKFDQITKKWQGRKFWGVSTATQLASSLTRYPLTRGQDDKKVIISSSSEDEKLKDIYSEDFNFVTSSGAGYKLLCVALGLADIYILSKPSVHYWDTCGPHAILRSLGGGIVDYQEIVSIDVNDKNPKQVQNMSMVDSIVRTEGAKIVLGCDQDEAKIGNANMDADNIKIKNNGAITSLRKISSCSQITYSVTPCDQHANNAERSQSTQKFIHLGGIFAYRQTETANFAIDCLRRNLG